MSDDDDLRELTKRAEEMGFQVIKDHTWGYVLYRPGKPLNPRTHSNRDLAEVREMLAGIELGRQQGTAED